MGTSGDARFEMNALQHFRLWIDENEEVEQQQQQTEIDNSLRFKLLQARKENIPGFRDYKHVPPYDYLVRKDHSVFKVGIEIFRRLISIKFMFRTIWLVNRKQPKLIVRNNNCRKNVRHELMPFVDKEKDN